MIPDKETYALVLDLRNALAAALRVIASDDFHGTRVEAFLAETKRIGIKEGLGVQADKWLEENKP